MFDEHPALNPTMNQISSQKNSFLPKLVYGKLEYVLELVLGKDFYNRFTH